MNIADILTLDNDTIKSILDQVSTFKPHLKQKLYEHYFKLLKREIANRARILENLSSDIMITEHTVNLIKILIRDNNIINTQKVTFVLVFCWPLHFYVANVIKIICALVKL